MRCSWIKMILSMIIALAFPRKSCSYENIALLKPTWQATTYLNHSGLGPEKAVDGLKFNRSWFGHQCSISTTGQTTATWWVDLQDILSIHHIIIYYRTDNVPWDSDNHFTTRFLGFSVFVSNTRNKEDGTLCFHDNEYNITTIADVVNITCTVHGQYVIYHNERLLTKEYPQDYSETAFNELCEVEVYGCPLEGYYGKDCFLPCLQNCLQCDIETGECIQCEPGFRGKSCEIQNIAYKHPTWQKTTHPSNFGPEKAVDGLKSDFSANGHQCSISANNQRVAFWRVNLLSRKLVHHIVIYYRTDGKLWDENNSLAARFLGFSLYISETESKDNGSLCFHDTEYNMTTIPAVVNITCELYGQYVIYYNERNSDTDYPPGYSTYAFNELCEVEVYGCVLGFYGSNCSLPCPAHCQNCNTETGDCLWCDVGYTGENCDFPCALGTFGANCTTECGECFGSCDHRYGNCSGGCRAGFTGIMCNEVCEPEKFGERCEEVCGMCLGECFHINGTCYGGCQSGYQGDLCKKECEPGRYGDGCLEYCGNCAGECNHVHGTCSGGCKAGYRGLTCKAECVSGSYGLNCIEQCGECLGDCNHFNGRCPSGCKPGYHGINCKEECVLGRYGVNCSRHCGECVEGCSNIDGSCVGGCKIGYEGKTCHKVCDFGFFGANCQQECSMFCFTSQNCSRMTGHCLNGCKQGWQGMDCLEMRDFNRHKILGSTETVAVLTISLSVNVCLVFAYCIRRYKAPQEEKKKIYFCTPRHNFMREGVQTGAVSFDVEDHSEREYNELQFLHINTENDYNNL